jgi:hypothetical protein
MNIALKQAKNESSLMTLCETLCAHTAMAGHNVPKQWRGQVVTMLTRRRPDSAGGKTC